MMSPVSNCVAKVTPNAVPLQASAAATNYVARRWHSHEDATIQRVALLATSMAATTNSNKKPTGPEPEGFLDQRSGESQLSASFSSAGASSPSTISFGAAPSSNSSSAAIRPRAGVTRLSVLAGRPRQGSVVRPPHKPIPQRSPPLPGENRATYSPSERGAEARPADRLPIAFG